MLHPTFASSHPVCLRLPARCARAVAVMLRVWLPVLLGPLTRLRYALLYALLYALRCALLYGLLGCGTSLTLAQAPAPEDPSPCGSLANGYGPFDYLTQKSKLAIVEQFHFTAAVEMLVRGRTSVHVGSDLDYTLRAFPNHHRALLSMQHLGQRLRTPQPVGAGFPVECYFERALRFRPHDTTARLLYANYLFGEQRQQDALGQMEVAASEAGDNAFTHYNMGLIYLEHKYYPQARKHAHAAYDLGFTRPGLRERLQRLGHWP